MTRYPAPASGPVASTRLSANEPVRLVDGLPVSWGARGTSFMTCCKACKACTTTAVGFGLCRLCY